MTTADNQPLGQALAENQAFLQTMFGGSSDFYTKSFTICGCRCCIAMFAGFPRRKNSASWCCTHWVKACRAARPGRSWCSTWQSKAAYPQSKPHHHPYPAGGSPRRRHGRAAGGGQRPGAGVFYPGYAGPQRDQPQREGNMRGPQDAFTEHLRNNISQLRRQFRTGSFTAEICTANTRAKTEYAICYDTALAPADVVQTLKQRLAGVQIPVLLDSTYFASFLKQDKLNLFPAAAIPSARPPPAPASVRAKSLSLYPAARLPWWCPAFCRAL